MAWCCPLQDGKPFLRLLLRIEKALFNRFLLCTKEKMEVLTVTSLVFSGRFTASPIVRMEWQKRGEVAGFLLQFCCEGLDLGRERRSHRLWLLGLRRTSVLRWNNLLKNVCTVYNRRRRSARAAFGALAFLLPISPLASLASHSPQSDHPGIFHHNCSCQLYFRIDNHNQTSTESFEASGDNLFPGTNSSNFIEKLCER